MTAIPSREAQALLALKEARAKAAHFRRLRNAWRRIVRRRVQRVREIRSAGPRRKGNLIFGGTLKSRAAFLFETAPPLFRLDYEEYKPYADFRWAVHNVPKDDWRTDCSTWSQNVVRCVRATGELAKKILATGSAFYTGWVVENCPEVDRHYAETHIGTAVIFGTGTGFHMGLSRAAGQALIQHGREPLEYGTFDQFGAGTEVRYFKFLT